MPVVYLENRAQDELKHRFFMLSIKALAHWVKTLN
jgi:hypothetical protein